MAHIERAINEKRFCQTYSETRQTSFKFPPRANCNRVNCTGKDCVKNGWFNHQDKPICWKQFCGIHPAQEVKNRHLYPVVTLDHARNYFHPLRTEGGLWLSESDREEAFITSMKELWSDEQMYRKAPDDNISPATPLRISFLEFFRIPINEEKPPPKVKEPRPKPKHHPMPIPKANHIPCSQGRFGVLQQGEHETEEINSSKVGTKASKGNLPKASEQPAAKAKAAGPPKSKAKAASKRPASPVPKAASVSPPPKADSGSSSSQGDSASSSSKANPSNGAMSSKDGPQLVDVTSKKNSKRGLIELKVVNSDSAQMPPGHGEDNVFTTADEKTDKPPIEVQPIEAPPIEASSVSTFISNILSGTETITVDTIIPNLPTNEDELDRMVESIKKSNEELIAKLKAKTDAKIKAEAEAKAKAEADAARFKAKLNTLVQCELFQKQLLESIKLIKADQAD